MRLGYVANGCYRQYVCATFWARTGQSHEQVTGATQPNGDPMTITLQMPPGLEASLRDQASREGVDASTLVLRALERQFGPAVGPSPAADEAELLLRINEGPSEMV